MEIALDRGQSKARIFEAIDQFLQEKELRVVSKDAARPWGGFVLIDESQLEAFISLFFPGENLVNQSVATKLSPKILVVEPGKRLSWQYHNRRSEIWQLVAGSAGVITSDTDIEGPVRALSVGACERIQRRERHRLVGLPDGWGVLAELWQHSDPNHPSDEEDIVRVQDDFGRT